MKFTIYTGTAMVGLVDSLMGSFQECGTLQRNMRCTAVACLLVLVLLIPMASSEISGRDAPDCLELNTNQLQNTITIDTGVCAKVNLGVLQPGDVYDISISIINDAVDVLFFDQNQILTYDAGQSYRSQFNQIISTESALGGYNFHWKVPASINPKTYFMVLDNLAHNGDNGQGDQGGSTSQIGVSVSKIDESFWTPFHDVIAVDSNEFATLLSGDSLKLDAGTTIVVTAWALTGQADVYLQTRSMHDLYLAGDVGQLFVAELDLQSVAESDSDTWTVPEELDGEELLIIVDNTNTPVGGAPGDSDIRITVRVELAPILQPIISASEDGATTIGEAISINANDSPNRIGQIATLSWDFDDTVDEDQDGIFTNDNQAQGFEVTSSWTSIGDKVVTLTATAPNQQVATTSYTISVLDVLPPTPIISSSAEAFSGGWKTSINQDTAFSCSSSTDDDVVASCLWEWGGVFTDNNNSVSIAWPNIGTYQVNLTVTDGSGNIATSTAVVVVDDSSIPSFSNVAIDALPSSAIEGKTLSLSIDASDAYDKSYQLTYHWDLNPRQDSDANGDPTDDPDYVGSSVDVKLMDVGSQDIVVTVFDQSGNSDSHAFSVNVAAAAEVGGVLGIVFVALFLGLVTISVAMIGFRKWQIGIAVQLLQGRGLSESEALQHIQMVRRRGKIPLFADAPVLAGLDSGQQVVTNEQRIQQDQDAEYQSIYGAPIKQTESPAAFAPPATIQPSPSFVTNHNQYPSASQSAAADAMAMFAEEENQEIIETNTAADIVETVTQVVSGGIALPHQVKAEIEPLNAELSKDIMSEKSVDIPVEKPAENVALSGDDLTVPIAGSGEPVIQRVSCPHCATKFNIAIPDADEAVVACPSCGEDFMLRFA